VDAITNQFGGIDLQQHAQAINLQNPNIRAQLLEILNVIHTQTSNVSQTTPNYVADAPVS